jgi:hypothetical protein
VDAAAMPESLGICSRVTQGYLNKLRMRYHAEPCHGLQGRLGTTELRIDIQTKVPQPHDQMLFNDASLEW